MLVLIYGGAASGKSEYAETLAVSLAHDHFPLFYTATLDPSDSECMGKINRHRALRRGKHFVTVECPRGLSELRLPGRGVVLLECLSTLAANELFSRHCDGESAFAEIRNGVDNLLAQSEHLVVVSNSLFGDGGRYDPFTTEYLRLLGRLHCELAGRAELVTEVVAGLPITQKDTRKEVRE